MRKDRYNGYNDKAQEEGSHTYIGVKCDDCGLVILESEDIIIPKIMNNIPCSDGIYSNYTEEEMIEKIVSYLRNLDSYVSIRYNGDIYTSSGGFHTTT